MTTNNVTLKLKTMKDAMAKLHTLATGTVLDVEGTLIEVQRCGHSSVLRTLARTPEAMPRIDDGRQYRKVMMNKHQAMCIVAGG
jgi:hypothetical protein